MGLGVSNLMFDITRLDVSSRTDRALIKRYALREGVWMTLPPVERRLFDLTLHPTIERWWGRVRWPLALDLLRGVVKRLRLAICFLKSRYFRRCYLATQASTVRALKGLEAAKNILDPKYREEYIRRLKEAMRDPDLIMYIGTKILYETPGQGLKIGLKGL